MTLRFDPEWTDPGERHWFAEAAHAPVPDVDFTELEPLVLFLHDGSEHLIHLPWGFARRRR